MKYASFILFYLFSIVVVAQSSYSDPNFAIPATGYGSEGTHTVGVYAFTNPNFPSKDIEVYYPSDVTGKVPTIFYSHAYGGNVSANISGLLNFVAKKGYAIVYVPYQTLGVTVDDRYANLLNGFRMAARAYPAVIDTTRVGFMGHSFGGGASFGLAHTCITENNWGENGRFIYALAQWYTYHIDQSELQNYPSDVKVLIEVFNDDVTNDHRMAIDIFNTIGIPSSEKDFILLKSSSVNGYDYVADHGVPATNVEFDALDYYAIYRLLDALCDYTFVGSAAGKNVALGNGSAEQVTMPAGMNNLEQTDNPMVVYPEDKYEFYCSNVSLNPREQYCPDITTALIPADVSSIQVYPNPVSTIVKINLPEFSMETVLTIYNSKGELVYQSVVDSGEVNLSFLPAGLYYFSYGSCSAKVMKE